MKEWMKYSEGAKILSWIKKILLEKKKERKKKERKKENRENIIRDSKWWMVLINEWYNEWNKVREVKY